MQAKCLHISITPCPAWLFIYCSSRILWKSLEQIVLSTVLYYLHVSMEEQAV